jgi:hypothetical protein
MSADFVQYDLGSLNAGSVVEITLGHRANVHLVDAHNVNRYRRGEAFDGIGGEALRSPLQLRVPSTGHWSVVIDLGGAAGTIRSGVRVLVEA